jgi:hypothetical protein
MNNATPETEPLNSTTTSSSPTSISSIHSTSNPPPSALASAAGSKSRNHRVSYGATTEVSIPALQIESPTREDYDNDDDTRTLTNGYTYDDPQDDDDDDDDDDDCLNDEVNEALQNGGC